jgi:hypothetical protein
MAQQDACVAVGCSKPGVREITDSVRTALGIPAEVNGLVCHSCRQINLVAQNARRQEVEECAACRGSFKAKGMSDRGLSERDSNVLEIVDPQNKPRVCRGCYSKLQCKLRKLRQMGEIETSAPARTQADYKKENSSLRKQVKVAEEKCRRHEHHAATSAVLDGTVMGQSKLLKAWDVNSSKTSSSRYADFIVGQVEHMATPANKKACWNSTSVSKRPLVCIDAPLKVSSN